MSGALGSVARLGLTAVGYYFGGPAGGFIGSLAGSFLFPEKLPDVEGQRINDAPVTTSYEGASMSEYFGSWVTAAQVWWDGGMVEHRETDEVGGKGGPSQKVVSYRYTRSYALGLGKSIKSVRRIWRLNQLIYDRRPQQPGETNATYTKRLATSDELDERMRIYIGTTDQMPDPTIEAAEGVGNAPAYRKRSYLVFVDDDVTDTNGAIPTYRVEVSNAGYEYTPTTEMVTDALHPWLFGEIIDPRNPLNDHEYNFAGNSAGSAAPGQMGFSPSWTTAQTEEEAKETFVTIWELALPAVPVGALTLVAHRPETNIENLTGKASVQVGPLDDVQPHDRVTVTLHFNESIPALYEAYAQDTGIAEMAHYVSLGATPSNTAYRTLGRQLGTWFYASRGTSAENPSWPGNEVGRAFATSLSTGFESGGNEVFGNVDCMVQCRRLPSAPAVPGSELPDWPVDPDDYTYDPETGEIFSKQPFSKVSGSYKWLSIYEESGSPAVVGRYPIGPVAEVGSEADSQESWEAAYQADQDSDDPKLPPGMTYDPTGAGGINTYPRNAAYAWTRSYTAITVLDSQGDTLANIVRRCGRLATLSNEQLDVTDLTELVDGYALERLGLTARGAIDTLRPFGFFDNVSSGLQLKFPTRGKASVAELTFDDLGCHEPGAPVPDRVRPDRSNDTPLPQMVRVAYVNPAAEFQRGQQLRGRVTVASENKLDVELPIAMDDDKAAQIRDVLMAERYIGRETYSCTVRPKYAWLEPADPIVLPIRGQLQRAIIISKRFVPGGRVELELRRDDATPYYATPAGVPSGIGEQALEPLGDTTLVVIDGPALSYTQNDAGVHLAARGDGSRWRGCGVFQSLDGGSDYTRIIQIDAPATMGRLTAALTVGPYDLWDRTNIIEVTLDSGTLESVEEDAAAGGANAAWVGAPGRWELVVFADAELTGLDSEGRKIYQVSTFLRGRLGTEWAIGQSEADDHFILARTCTRLPLDRSVIGVPRTIKAVSFGKLVESGPIQEVTPAGIALKPFAPTLPEGVRNDDGDLDIYAVRRARISGEWNDSDFVPLLEEAEAYEVDILDGTTVVQTLTGSGWPIRYSAEDQLDHFGSLQVAVSMNIFQISASVGRGYPLEVTL